MYTGCVSPVIHMALKGLINCVATCDNYPRTPYSL